MSKAKIVLTILIILAVSSGYSEEPFFSPPVTMDFVSTLDDTDATLSGEVLLSDDLTPIAGATIVASSGVYSFVANSGAAGSYSMEVVSGIEYNVTCEYGDLIATPRSHRAATTAGETVTDLDFLMTDPSATDAFIAGRVSYSDGSPAIAMDVKAVSSMTAVEYNASTDTEGNYSIPVVGGSEYRVTLGTTGLSVDPWEYYIPVVSGDSLPGNDFVIELSGIINAVIYGEITCPEGVDPSRAVVSAVGTDMYSTSPDDIGNFALGVSGGTVYSLTATYPPYTAEPSSYSVDISVGDTLGSYDFEFELTGGLDAIIEGVVFIHEGVPMEGITVIAESEDTSFSAVTNGEGIFSIACMSGTSYTLSCDHPEYDSSPESIDVIVDIPGRYAGNVFVLSRSSSSMANIGGQVTLDGEGIPGISIHGEGDGEFWSRTDEDGYYSLDISPGEYTLYIESEFYLSTPESHTLTVAAGDTIVGLDFALEGTIPSDAVFSGTVFQAGAPLSGARIEAVSDGIFLTDITGSDGTYEIFVPGGFEYYITCRVDGSAVVPESYSRYIEAGETISGLTFNVLGEGETALNGYIYNPDSSAASAIEVIAVAGLDILSSESDASGFYSIAITPGVTYDVRVGSDTIRTEPEMYPGLVAEEGVAISGLNFFILPPVEANVELSGTVTDNEGSPISGIVVHSSGTVEDETVTDGAGNFYIETYVLESGSPIYLSCEVEDEYFSDPTDYELFLNPDTSLSGLDFILTDLSSLDATVSGRITNSAGGGVSGIEVQAFNAEMSYYFNTLTDGSGFYALPVLGGVAYDIKPIAMCCLASPFSYSIAPEVDESIDGVDFILYERAFIGGSITEDGSPAADVTVIAERSTGEIFTTSSMADGTYMLSVVEGEFTVFISEGFLSEPASYELTFEPADTLLSFDFEVRNISILDAQISGRITDTEDIGILGVHITAYSDETERSYLSMSDSDGDFVIEVPGGFEYVITPSFGLSRFEPASRTVTVAEGGTSTGNNFVQDGMIEYDASISGSLEFSDGTPAIAYTVAAEGSDFILRAITDSSGFYTIDLPGGIEYNVHAETREYLVQPLAYREVYVESGTELEDYDFELLLLADADANVSGTVTYSSGGVADSVSVVIRHESGFEHWGYTDGSGNYNIPLFGGFRYFLEVNRPYFTSEPLDYYIEPASGESLEDYDFVLTAAGSSLEVLYHISTGWNMFSHPGMIPISSDEYFSSAISLYNYNPETRAYFTAEEMTLGNAFWLLSDGDRTENYMFESVATEIFVSLVPGWNFIGMCAGTTPVSTLLDNPSIISVFAYNPDTGGYYEPTSLEIGIGYWVLASESTILTLP